MINDDYIKELHKGYKSIIKHLEPDVKEYLENRYEDSESIKETIWRILNDIEQRPVCKICGGRVEFIGRKNIIFRRTCDNCRKHHEVTEEEKQYKKIYANSSKEKQKKLALERFKKTCLEKYGVDNPMKLKRISQQSIKTRMDNGWISPWTTDNPMKRKEVLEKRNKTNQERYGGNSPGCDPEVKKKQVETRYKKYNGKYTVYNEIYHQYLSEKQLSEETQNKIKKTCLEKYGSERWTQSDKFKQFLHEHMQEIINKGNETKRKNGTFNTSKQEDESYIILQEKFKDVKRNYKDKERYPFNCDFYIPELDLFIECQYHWTHGNHPYNEYNEEDIILAENWKNSESKFKNNAWHTWTIRDIKKRETAKQNNLNWIEFFNIEELKQWLQDTYIKP